MGSLQLPYTIQRSDELGRYLVASRNIEPGEIIISEQAILIAPSDSSKSKYLQKCLGCCQELNLDESGSNDCNVENRKNEANMESGTPTPCSDSASFSANLHRCSNCFFPCCSEVCEKINEHSNYECKLFREKHVRYTPPYPEVFYKSIMVLRALLLKKIDRSKFDSLLTMETHFPIRQRRPNSIATDEKLFSNLQQFFGDTAKIEDGGSTINADKYGTFDVDEIQKISGIIDVNAHLLPYTLKGKICTSGVCYVYRETSLLSHTCVPNAAWAVSPLSDSILVTRASTTIKQGDEIAVSYDVGELLYGTLRRIIPMEISGFFVCHCKRCIDPTELDTHLSTLICEKCKTGYVTSIEPTDSFSEWKCGNCSTIYSDEAILDRLEELESDIGFPKDNLLFSPEEDSLDELEAFKKRSSGILLHPSHYILQEIKLRWIKQISCKMTQLQDQKFYNRANKDKINSDQHESIKAMCQLLLSKYLPTCDELISLLSIIIPGASEVQAIIQFHACEALDFLIKNYTDEELEGIDLVDDCPNCNLSNLQKIQLIQHKWTQQLKILAENALKYFNSNYGFEIFSSKLKRLI